MTHLTPAEAAERLRTKVGTLATWRAQRRGPSYIKNGRSVLYPVDAIEAYERENMVVCDG